MRKLQRKLALRTPSSRYSYPGHLEARASGHCRDAQHGLDYARMELSQAQQVYHSMSAWARAAMELPCLLVVTGPCLHGLARLVGVLGCTWALGFWYTIRGQGGPMAVWAHAPMVWLRQTREAGLAHARIDGPVPGNCCSIQ